MVCFTFLSFWVYVNGWDDVEDQTSVCANWMKNKNTF